MRWQALLGLLVALVLNAAQAAAPIELRRAAFLRDPGDAVPADAAAWQSVTLPNSWRAADGGETVWYRLDFTLAQAPSSLQAIYLTALSRAGRIWVNGELAGAVGDFADPMPVNWNRPQLIVVPPGLLRPGPNHVHVQERAYDFQRGTLSEMWLGDEAELRARYDSRRWWQNDLVMLMGAVCAAMSVFVLGLWVRRREQTMYLWFGCATLVWSVVSLDFFSLHTPLDGVAWEKFIECMQVLHAVLIELFVLRYIGWVLPRLEHVLWVYWGIGSVADFAGMHATIGVDLWYMGILLTTVYFLQLLVRHAWRVQRLEAALVALAALVSIAFSSYDLWLFSGHFKPGDLYLGHYGAPVFMAVMGGLLLRRFTDSLHAYEKLNAELEDRVAVKAAALERQMAALAEAQRSEALARERARIMGEMHDGIGSQLTMALALVERGGGGPLQVAGVLRESIDDLQLIIDSLEPVDSDLLTVLGNLRYRVQDRFVKSGIAVDWQVSDLPAIDGLTPSTVLAVLRILQEAFANCLKHAGATRIAVGVAWVDEVAEVRVVDNGRGIGPGRRGRGLDSMQRRASSIGATLAVESKPGETAVTLRLPARRAAAA